MTSFGFKYTIIPDRTGSISPMRRKIYVYDINFELLKSFDTVSSAAIEYKVGRGDISKSIRNVKTLKNMYFSYDNPFKEPKCAF